MRSLGNAGEVADTRSLLDQVNADGAAASGPVGCVVYCMSGQFVLSEGAAYGDGVAATASYYGVGIITDKEDPPRLAADDISAEVYLALAWDGPYVPQPIIDALPEVMQSGGATHRIEIYPDTEHGFAFPQRQAYRRAAAELRWVRLFALFDRTLRK